VPALEPAVLQCLPFRDLDARLVGEEEEEEEVAERLFFHHPL